MKNDYNNIKIHRAIRGCQFCGVLKVKQTRVSNKCSAFYIYLLKKVTWCFYYVIYDISSFDIYTSERVLYFNSSGLDLLDFDLYVNNVIPYFWKKTDFDEVHSAGRELPYLNCSTPERVKLGALHLLYGQFCKDHVENQETM